MGCIFSRDCDAPPDDADGDATDGADPVVYQPLAFDGLNAVVPYQMAFVETGDYTVAATCQLRCRRLAGGERI